MEPYGVGLSMIKSELEEVREAVRKQGVPNALALAGPIGDRVRAILRPKLERLHARGVLTASFRKYYQPER